VKWLSANEVIITYVNREQNAAVTAINDATTGQVQLSKVNKFLFIIRHFYFLIEKLYNLFVVERFIHLIQMVRRGFCPMVCSLHQITIITFKFGLAMKTQIFYHLILGFVV
jgi:hypothetical protein